MIIVTNSGCLIHHHFFPREVCIQVYPTWSWPHDEIGLRDDGLLYGITDHTQHGVDEAYRTQLRELEARLPEFEQAMRDLHQAKVGSAKFASQPPIVHTVKSIFGQDGPSLVKYGNVWVRRWRWKKGEVLEGHKHNFDHVSLLYRGSAKVTVDGVETTYTAPIELIIAKDKEHRIEALEDNTVWMCVFAVRDENGEVDIYGNANNPASHT